jgi:hypothetical protein
MEDIDIFNFDNDDLMDTYKMESNLIESQNQETNQN